MDDSTEEIRRRADIVEVVGQYVALRPAGNDRFKGCCPFHDEKTASFNVSRDKGFYHCFGCKESGDVFKFVQKIENLNFAEAKKQLADRYGIALRPNRELTTEQQATYDERDRLIKIMGAAAAFFSEQFAGNKGLEARDYARQRGLSRATIERFAIGYAPDSWDALRLHLINRHNCKLDDAVAAGLLVEKEQEDGRVRHYDRYRHRLMFPIWDEQGRVIAFGGRALPGGETGNPDAKYINSPEGILFKKSRVLYAFHIARSEVVKREAAIVTEGYMDAVALHQAGFGNTMAALGTALTVQHVMLMRRLAPKIVYLCYDGDSAGMQAALRAGPLFSANNLDVRVVALPPGDDPDTYVRKHGEIGFANLLRQAQHLGLYRLEMQLAQFDMSNPMDRKRAIHAAAEVIGETADASERRTYVAWLAERIEMAEGALDLGNRAMLERAILIQVEAATKHAAAGQRQEPRSAYMRIEDNLRGQDDDRREVVSEFLTEQSAGKLNGVGKAERMLLCTMLADPHWRGRVARELPLKLWTRETHREIASALGGVDENAVLDGNQLLASLTAPAAQCLGEMMLSDEAHKSPEERIVQGWIERVQRHWARKNEREFLEYLTLKLARGEKVDPEDSQKLGPTLVATKRKRPEVIEPEP